MPSDSSSAPAVLERVDALRAELDAMRPLDPDRLGAAMQRLRIEWTYHSNAIEGNSLTYGETRALLMHGVTADGKPLKDHLDIKGHREALDYLEQVVQSREPLTLASIREMHGLLLGEPYETWAETPDGQRVRRTITPGEFKTMPNHVRTETGETHYYARPEEVPALMQDLMDLVRDGWADVEGGAVHPVVFASDVHHRFAAIHPFDDGNGRMARLLMNLVLMRAGYPPAVLRQQNRRAYYGALAAADGGDLEPLVRFVTDELAATLELYLRALRGDPDPDIFDRRLALLKREVEMRDERKGRPPAALVQLVALFLSPFLERLTQGFAALPPLFDTFVESQGGYTAADGQQYLPGSQLVHQLGTVEWTSFVRAYCLERYVSDASQNLTLEVTGAVEDGLVSLRANNGIGEIARVRFDQIPAEGVAVQLAERVLGVVLDRIQEIDRFTSHGGDS